MKNTLHPWVIKKIGRDWLEYVASNTMNVATEAFDPFIWTYDCKAKIVEVRQETADTKTFVLLPNQHFKQPLPGQHIELTVDIDNTGTPVARCYTLSEIQQDTVSITVKQNPDGKMSNWLHKYGREGMILDISSPRGQFVYRDQEKILFISAGSGITPCYSIYKAFETQINQPDVAFYYRSRTPDETIFRQQLEQTKNDNSVDISYSRHSEEEKTSYLPSQLIEAYPDIKERHIYLCGPEPFKNDVLSYLDDIGYDLNNLEVEHFAPLQATSQSVDSFTGEVSVLLKSKNIRFVIDAKDNDKTLLEAAEANGVQFEHGCRSGMCGTCRTNLVSGEVNGQQLGKSIYPCATYPASAELVIE